jgi:hypothetical protein
VGAGKNRHIHPPLLIGSGQNSMPFGMFKITAQIHHGSPKSHFLSDMF